MDKNTYNTLKTVFFDYTKQFYKNSRLDDALQEKLNHIIRVSENCVYIAKNIKLDENDILKAEICGLYHDIGRFSQLRDYKTLDDSKSVNHGIEGYNTIIKNNLLNSADKIEAETILNSVKFHNAISIPDNLNEQSVLFTNIVRDADKLDIFFMLNEAIVTNKIQNDKSTVWNLDFKEANQVILDKILNNECASYSEVKSATDVCILQLGWIYDLNFYPTLQHIKDMKCIENINRIIPLNKKTIETLNHLKNYMNNKIRN